MFLSISLILFLGLSLGSLCKKIKLPSLLGMLVAGIVLGPYALNLLDDSILTISGEIRKIALIIILTRAGLGLDLEGLKKLGMSAFLMCFLPASFELLGTVIIAPKVMGISILDAAIMGAVLAAVSPAVVVPRMVKMMDEGYGVEEGIPQLILAGASVDDVFVIVLFTSFIGLSEGKSADIISFLNIPVSIILGIAIGIGISVLLSYFFKRYEMDDVVKVLILISISLLLSFLEDSISTPITFSSLIAVMFLGVGIQKKDIDDAVRISGVYKKLWIGAEVFLFALVGASVNIAYLDKVGLSALVIIVAALAFRMSGVFLCLLGTRLTWKERVFVTLAYTPKATVQAAIGGIPLSLGLSCGESILVVAVSAILLTAPLGAFAIDFSYKRLLSHKRIG